MDEQDLIDELAELSLGSGKIAEFEFDDVLPMMYVKTVDGGRFIIDVNKDQDDHEPVKGFS